MHKTEGKEEDMILKRLFKKNQIIITALAVMIAIAGYLNYSGRLFGAKEDGAKEASAGTANQELWISRQKIWRQTERLRAMIPKWRGHRGRLF